MVVRAHKYNIYMFIFGQLYCLMYITYKFITTTLLSVNIHITNTLIHKPKFLQKALKFIGESYAYFRYWWLFILTICYCEKCLQRLNLIDLRSLELNIMLVTIFQLNTLQFHSKMWIDEKHGFVCDAKYKHKHLKQAIH